MLTDRGNEEPEIPLRFLYRSSVGIAREGWGSTPSVHVYRRSVLSDNGL